MTPALLLQFNVYTMQYLYFLSSGSWRDLIENIFNIYFCYGFESITVFEPSNLITDTAHHLVCTCVYTVHSIFMLFNPHHTTLWQSLVIL